MPEEGSALVSRSSQPALSSPVVRGGSMSHAAYGERGSMQSPDLAQWNMSFYMPQSGLWESATEDNTTRCGNCFFRVGHGNGKHWANGSWLHSLLIVENQIRPPNVSRGNSDLFDAAVILWLPLQVHIFPLLKKKNKQKRTPRTMDRSSYMMRRVEWREIVNISRKHHANHVSRFSHILYG